MFPSPQLVLILQNKLTCLCLQPPRRSGHMWGKPGSPEATLVPGRSFGLIIHLSPARVLTIVSISGSFGGGCRWGPVPGCWRVPAGTSRYQRLTAVSAPPFALFPHCGEEPAVVRCSLAPIGLWNDKALQDVSGKSALTPPAAFYGPEGGRVHVRGYRRRRCR